MVPLEWKILMAKEALNDVPVQLALDEEHGVYRALDTVVKMLRTMIFEVERLAELQTVQTLPPPVGAPVMAPPAVDKLALKKQALAERRKI